MARLPSELLQIIFQSLTEHDLDAVSSTCKAWYALVPSEWQARLVKRFRHANWGMQTFTSSRGLFHRLTKLDLTRWTVAHAGGSPPADRGGHASAVLANGRCVVVHGGANGDVLHGDCFALIACNPGPTSDADLAADPTADPTADPAADPAAEPAAEP
eukprot:CAMPEP_0119330658 /NCGR_PEP_ID=MMETSP1333-20130426/78708_1 /TAXON_ID=418940 /ORGANISM="Scyphosphaera apsteinii, Strain RCC1455" /LENGTH=157 /DNA_ID=CAMNT_0007340071 /DNA_START=152 /DNA_END=622 /DNA_ORIENTATION=+